MNRGSVPDDIKTIAQFLAERDGMKDDWPRFAKEAFQLRRQLKIRAARAPSSKTG